MIIDAGRPRTRSRDRRKSVTYRWENYLGNSATGPVLNAAGTYEEMADFVVPRFAEKRAAGSILMNSMRSVRATMTGGHISDGKIATNPGALPTQWARNFGDQSRFCTGYGGTSVGDYWISQNGLSLFSASDIYNAQVEACTRVRSQIGRSNTDMWENLAEVNKTMDLLRSPLASWFKFEKKARAVTAGLTAAQAWLTYRYGVRPLVTSVDAVLKNMRKEARSVRSTTRSTVVLTAPLRTDTFQTNSSYWSSCYFTVERQRMASYLVRAMSIDEVISDFEYTYGVASKQLLTLPWELLPWSFVVDWFSNIGDFVGALAQSFYPASLGQCYVTEDTYSEYRRCLAMTAFVPSTIQVIDQLQGWTRADVITKVRSPGLLGPGIVIKQDFKLDSTTRIADSLALVGQQITRAFLGRK